MINKQITNIFLSISIPMPLILFYGVAILSNRTKEFYMDYANIKSEVEQKALSSIEVLKSEYTGLRTGRASVHLLDGVKAEVYGSEMPIDQLATISAPEAQVLTVSVWDGSNASKVEKAIRDSGLGLNPMTAGGVIRLNLPPLTEERRRDLVKVAKKYAEEAQVALRNVRQDAMNKIKKAGVDKIISEDDQHKYSEDLQKVIDAKSVDIDAIAKQKEIDIMSV